MTKNKTNRKSKLKLDQIKNIDKTSQNSTGDHKNMCDKINQFNTNSLIISNTQKLIPVEQNNIEPLINQQKSMYFQKIEQFSNTNSFNHEIFEIEKQLKNILINSKPEKDYDYDLKYKYDLKNNYNLIFKNKIFEKEFVSPIDEISNNNKFNLNKRTIFYDKNEITNPEIFKKLFSKLNSFSRKDNPEKVEILNSIYILLDENNLNIFNYQYLMDDFISSIGDNNNELKFYDKIIELVVNYVLKDYDYKDYKDDNFKDFKNYKFKDFKDDNFKDFKYDKNDKYKDFKDYNYNIYNYNNNVNSLSTDKKLQNLIKKKIIDNVKNSILNELSKYRMNERNCEGISFLLKHFLNILEKNLIKDDEFKMILLNFILPLINNTKISNDLKNSNDLINSNGSTNSNDSINSNDLINSNDFIDFNIFLMSSFDFLIEIFKYIGFKRNLYKIMFFKFKIIFLKSNLMVKSIIFKILLKFLDELPSVFEEFEDLFVIIVNFSMNSQHHELIDLAYSFFGILNENYRNLNFMNDHENSGGSTKLKIEGTKNLKIDENNLKKLKDLNTLKKFIPKVFNSVYKTAKNYWKTDETFKILEIITFMFDIDESTFKKCVVEYNKKRYYERYN
ncbi:hypothetical protein DMUE_5111 [Dictyocoela muelleri]|nr:hypothetical protein DMUE_5111 [Dictyocoela muelleri]